MTPHRLEAKRLRRQLNAPGQDGEDEHSGTTAALNLSSIAMAGFHRETIRACTHFGNPRSGFCGITTSLLKPARIDCWMETSANCRQPSGISLPSESAATHAGQSLSASEPSTRSI